MKGFILKVAESEFFVPVKRVVRVDNQLNVHKWYGLSEMLEGVCVTEKTVIGVFDIGKKLGYDIKNGVYLLIEGNERMYVKVESVRVEDKIPEGVESIDTIKEIKKILKGESNG